MKTITFKNSHLSVLPKVLTYGMPFNKGRMRNRFLALIVPSLQEFEKNRTDICVKFSKKDKNKEPIIEENDKGQQVYVIDNIVKFNKELDKLRNEDCVIDLPSAVRGEIPIIINLIQDSRVELDDSEITLVEQNLIAMGAKD